MSNPILVHDTITKIVNVIDTLRIPYIISKTASNGIQDFWLTVPISSLLIGIVLLFGNWIKDKWFEKRKGLHLINQFKFEKNHPKRIELIEKIISEISIIDAEYLGFFFTGAVNEEKIIKLQENIVNLNNIEVQSRPF